MIVIKYGGHAMKDESGAFAQAISAAIAQGLELVIVHGGGPQIDAALVSAGIQSQSIGGFRVTTPEIFEINSSTSFVALLAVLTLASMFVLVALLLFALKHWESHSVRVSS